jgi:Tfp pilus assembly protein PilO
MKRSQILLFGAGAVLVIILFFVLLFQPAREDLAEVEDRITAEQDQQAQLTQAIARLRSVRDEAPEVEADLAAAEAIVPRDAALPSALRQMQLAADESGVVLQSVATSRPAELPEATEGLSSIEVTTQATGGYFQMIDFLRRLEDPAITPRGLVWNNATMAIGSEYPELQATLSGRVFAVISSPAPPETDEAADPDGVDNGAEGDDAGDGSDVDVDVDVDADVEEIS